MSPLLTSGDNFFDDFSFKKNDSTLSEGELNRKSADFFATRFADWFHGAQPDSVYQTPTFQQNQDPCATSFFRDFRNKYQALLRSLENFFLLFRQLRDDAAVLDQNRRYFKNFDETFEGQILRFSDELEQVNTERETSQLGQINLNRFKEARKLINRQSNSHAQFNYEVATFFKNQVETEFMKKTQDGFDSTAFVKKLESQRTVFKDKVDETLALMREQGLQSLYLQKKLNPKLDPKKSEFLAPYQRYLKYKKVKSG